MSYFDYQVSRDLVQRHVAEVRRRSEARYRLYWSTVLRQAPASRRDNRVWSRVGRLLSALRRWRPERVPSEMRVGEDGRRAYLQASEQGEA